MRAVEQHNVTVHSVPVTGKNPCKNCNTNYVRYANGFLFEVCTFSYVACKAIISSKC